MRFWGVGTPHPARTLLVLLLCACHDQGPTETIPLHPDATFPRTISHGQPHRFRFDLAAGQFLHLSVEQRGIDVVVGLLDPSGRLLYEVDSPTGDREREPVLAVAPVSGTYTLRIVPWTAGAEGNFTLAVHEIRPAGPDERARAATASLFARAESLLQEGDVEAAVAGFRAALPDLERRGETRAVAQAEWRLGTARGRTGALRESATFLERSAVRFRRLGDSLTEAQVLTELGGIWQILGEPARALEAHRRALDLYRRAGPRSGEASSIHNLGTILENTGELQKAIARFEEALALRRQIEEKSGEASTLQRLGSIYVLIGHDEEGLDFLRKALELREGENDTRARISILIDLGWAEHLSGQPAKALERFRQAIDLARSSRDRLSEAGVLDRQATALKALGRFEEASACYLVSLEISRSAGSHRYQGHTLANLGWLSLERKDFARARQNLRQAVDFLVESGDPNGEVFARVGLSRAERLLGSYGPARQQIEIAIQRVEELRTGLRGAASRGQLVATRYDAYEELVALLMELDRREPGRGHAREALEVAERARARNLLDLLAVDAPSPSERRSVLQAEIQEMDERRRAIEARDPRDPRLPSMAAALRERALELDRLPPLPGEGRAMGERGGRGGEVSWRQVQDLADSETLLVVYLLAEPESFAWTIDRERIVPHILPGRQKIETLARRLATAFPQSHEKTARGAAERAANNLAEAILAPLGDRLESPSRLVILPDGALNLVAFAGLPSPPLPGGRVLLDTHEIVLIPSATVLIRQRERLAGRPPAPEKLAVLADPIFSRTDPRLTRGRPGASPAGDRGDPALGFGPLARLPFTAEEARAIARLVPEDEQLVVLGAAASRDLAMSGTLSRYHILHFATHGLLHPVLPERSGLVLSLVDGQGSPRDGFLSAPDVAALDLPADLVVLSSCRSGLGREIRGEGLVGLTQAFFRAGARRVIVSSWDVRDRATADLMTRFYTHLLVDRLPPAAALRAAQLALRDNPATAAPSFWAGFTLHGDWQ